MPRRRGQQKVLLQTTQFVRASLESATLVAVQASVAELDSREQWGSRWRRITASHSSGHTRPIGGPRQRPG